MSNLPQQNTIAQFLANGIQTNYSIVFYVPIEPSGTPDINVYTQLATADPVPESDLKTWNTDYIYTPLANPYDGGTVTFLPEKIPPNGYVVTIARNIAASLNVEFANATTFSGLTLDAALDKLLLITQQNKSYTLGRNLSYIINSYLPSTTIAANVQIPVLGSGEVWFGSSNGVIAATLEQPADVSTLRSELASESPVTNGAALVGYYDDVNSNPTTVEAQLTLLTNAVVAPFPTGTIIDFGGTVAPAGFLVCDGSTQDTTLQSALFAVIQYTWGGSGTSFTLPNLNRRTTIGSGGTATTIIGNEVGNTSSDETSALTDINQIPSHTHAVNSPGATTNTELRIQDASGISGTTAYQRSSSIPSSVSGQPGTASFSLANTGSASPDGFNIIQASAVVLKCIKT